MKAAIPMMMFLRRFECLEDRSSADSPWESVRVTDRFSSAMNDFPLKYSEANQPGRYRPITTKIKFKPTDLIKRMGKRCGCRWPTEMRTARLLSLMVHFSSLTLFFNIQLENQESNWE